jgi:thioesterase domain-containing protein
MVTVGGESLFAKDVIRTGRHLEGHYRHLIGDLKSNRPVFGLQPPPLDGKHRAPRTIKSIAADYVSEIRRVQPHGPYFIGGVSFGAWVSFEIAQQLVREGERVNFLGLIDPVLHDS